MIKLEEVIEFTKEQSRAIVESGEEHQPIMLAITPKGANPVLLRGLEKDRFKQDIGTLLHQIDAYAYVFINEAWIAKLPNNSSLIPRLLSGEISVSELPLDDKEEILMIMATENGKSCSSWFAKIQYTPDDKRYLGEWMKMQGIPEGRLILREW